ncbi:hypothetical protein [Kribbella sp. CA-294648]|uniref:hypothetical protein n=1 Tax=Kribbella sp. CA-294648 TaxID=3239948 RepID=UPI003D8E8E35
MVRRSLVLAAVLVLITGCSTVDSADIDTSGITANLLVTVPDGTTTAEVSATLRVGTMTYVELGGGEKISASGGGHTATLKRGKLAGATSYTGRLDGACTAGTEITFALERDGGKASAPTSVVKIPEPIRLTAPAAGARISRQSDLVLRFAAAADGGVLSWAGPCVQGGSVTLEGGRTSATISRGTIRALPTPTPNAEATVSCELILTLTRRSDGTLDKTFKDGSVAAEIQTVRQVVTAP